MRSITVRLPQTVSTTLRSEEDRLQVSQQVSNQPVNLMWIQVPETASVPKTYGKSG